MVFKYINNKKGQAIVEFAIILPVLLLIFMGIFEFGRVMNAYLILNHASREGARMASVGEDDGAIRQRITEATTTLSPLNQTVTIAPTLNARRRGTTVSVKVAYDIDIVTPIIEVIIPDPLHLEAQTIMRVE